MEPFDATLGFLARVRRELAAVARGETFFLALTTLLGVGALTLGLAALLGAGPGRWAWVVLALGLGGLGYVVWRFWSRPKKARAVDSQLALWVEERVPELGSGLVTSVEVGGLLRRAAKPEDLGFSPRLATETARRTVTLLAGVRPERLPDRSRLARFRWIALGSVLVTGLLLFLAPGLWTRGMANLVAPSPDRGDNGERLVDVAVSQLDIEVTPPKYTGLDRRKLPRSSGDVEALAGSEVRFATTALFPVTGAALVLQSSPDARWLLELETDGTIKGSFQVGQSDRYQLVVTDASGQRVRERVWRTVTATPDQAPEVTLLLPEQDLEVKPTDTIQFFYEASDDLGIDKVDLVVADDGGTEISRRSVAQAKGNRIDKGNTALEVGSLGLEPGQSVDVHFEVADLNTLSGPGIGKSQARRIKLYSPQDEHDKLLGRLEELIEKMLDVLAERLESPVDAEQPERIADFMRLHQAIGSATEAIANELEDIVNGLKNDTLVKDDMRDGVREVLDQIRDAYEQEQAHLKKWVLDPDLADPRVLVALLAQTNTEAVDVFEQGILKLKRLMDGALKDSIMEAGRELLETQNEIMDLLKKLKDNPDPAAREAAMKKLRQLQEKLKKLQEQIARAQDKAPYENQNAAQRPNENQANVADMQDTMDKVQKLLEEGKIDEAMKLMEEMAKSTQQLMAALENDLEGGGSSMSPESRRKLQEVQQQLDELADGQRGVQKETGGVKQQMDEREQKELEAKAQEKLDDLKGKAKEIRDALNGAPKEGLQSMDKAELYKLEEAAQGLEKALEQMKIGDAGKQAKEIAKGSGNLQGEVGESAAREMAEQRTAELRKAMKQLGKAQAAAAELAEMIEDMKGKPGEGASPGEGQKMEQLGKQQKELGQKLQQLREKLGQMEQEFPGISDELGKPLDEAGGKMGEAKQSLDGKQPGPAGEQQQEALEKLQQAQQSMQERMKKSQKDGGTDDESTGVNNPKADVEIPKDDPYARPRKLREEILRMMEEQAPERYKDAIKKFYEDLTK
ncbi:MAG: DUF4175 family protein [Myxococcota bacterium]